MAKRKKRKDIKQKLLLVSPGDFERKYSFEEKTFI